MHLNLVSIENVLILAAEKLVVLTQSATLKITLQFVNVLQTISEMLSIGAFLCRKETIKLTPAIHLHVD